MKKLILLWFKINAAKSAKKTLLQYQSIEVKIILDGYWQTYLKLKPEIPSMPTLGGSVMLHLAAMSMSFYKELIAKGNSEESATIIFYDIAWKVYVKMGKVAWFLAGLSSRDKHLRLNNATKLFRIFPFNSPSYLWEDVKTDNKNVVRFNCVKCPVAKYLKSYDLSGFCAATWCALDYPLAELWHARLERSGSIAGGAKICDFRWLNM